eukprot:gb/GFBE01071363.1/.p1 GENE.gb/GFBE01071363.1/~~gb/GFBE01071363.1/.p1  ORF type:complete len:429 (+),score=85.78 gb/GFBE01071363.1/:1-1287(+)
MKLHVSGLSGTCKEIEVDGSVAVTDFKVLLADFFGPARCRKVLLDGRELVRGSLDDCGVKEGSQLTVVDIQMQMAVTAHITGKVMLWDVESGQCLKVLGDHTNMADMLYYATLSPDGTRIGTVGEEGAACIFSVDTGELLFTLAGHQQEVYHKKTKSTKILYSRVRHISFSPDGSLIATGGGPNCAKIWNASGEQMQHLELPFECFHTAFSWGPSDSTMLATASMDCTLWEPRSGKMLAKLSDQSQRYSRVAFSEDSRVLGVGLEVTVWDRNGEKIWTIQEPTEATTGFRSAAFCGDSDVAVIDSRCRVQIINAAGKLMQSFSGFTLEEPKLSISTFTRDGKKLLAVNREGGAVLWDLEASEKLADIETASDINTQTDWGASFSADGSRLALLNPTDSSVRVFDGSGVLVSRFQPENACDGIDCIQLE